MPVIVTSSFVLSPPSSIPLNHARIGYITHAPASTFTATSEANGFSVNGLKNSITMRRWKPTTLPATATADMGAAKDIEYVGLAGHTFGTNGNTITVSYSTDGVNYTTIEAVEPSSDKPIMMLCNVSARYIRLAVSGGTIPSVGVMYFGALLEMQRPFYRGHSPMALSRNTKKVPRTSESGQFLSNTSIRSGTSSTYAWQNLNAAWYRANFVPFVRSLENEPCFIAWNSSQFAEDVEFAWTNDNISPTNSGPRDLMSVSINFMGLGDG